MNKFFSFLIFILICINTLTLCFDRYPISDAETEILDLINQICFGFFALEMVIKIVALGPKLYARDKFNIFDCFIIFLSVAEISLKYSSNQVEIRKAFLAFRVLRLLRVFKLAR